MAEQQEELWMARKDRDRLKVLHEVRKRHHHAGTSGERVGHQSALGTGVVAADESSGRPGDGCTGGGGTGRTGDWPEAMKARAVKTVSRAKASAAHGHDYGPTLAAEELAEHGLKVGKRRCESGCCRPDCGRRGSFRRDSN